MKRSLLLVILIWYSIVSKCWTLLITEFLPFGTFVNDLLLINQDDAFVSMDINNGSNIHGDIYSEVHVS